MRFPVLDLHGRDLDEVCDLVDQHITKYSHCAKVKIIVGKGAGIVRKEVIKFLKMGKYTWEYEIIRGRKNTGCLIVELR